MNVSSFDERLSGEAFEDSPTVRLYLDGALVEDLDYIGLEPVPGSLVVCVESEDRRRAWLRPIAVVLAGVLLAVAASWVLRFKGSPGHGSSPTVPGAAVSRLLPRAAGAAGLRGLPRVARRAARRPAYRRRVAIEGASAPRSVARAPSPVVPSRVVYVPARAPVPVAPPHGEEFGFER
jgi:hypothetical protein